MNTKKLFAFALGGTLLTGCLTGYRAMMASQAGIPDSSRMLSPGGMATSDETLALQAQSTGSGPICVCKDGGAYTMFHEEEDSGINYEQLFQVYKPFGLTYDAEKNELRYNGKLVRWFEDYYPVSEDGGWAGNDFFHENGVVDVYAVRDFPDPIRSADGSFDPGGTLVGVKEFSKQEFAARDIKAIKNQQPIAIASGDGIPSAKELENVADEYAAFGVTYDAKEDQWYWNGEKVRFIWDILTSNGESLTGGNFHGTLRSLESPEGTIGIYTVRDFATPDISGNGTLTGMEMFSQEEFNKRTKPYTKVQTYSGLCTVTQGEQ